MNRFEATYRITTPMFIAGADIDTAELRPPSVKGALRFWFRGLALSNSNFWQDIKYREARLFGSTDFGQAGFLMKLSFETDTEDNTEKRGTTWSHGVGIRYLGYGLNQPKQGGSNSRPYLKEGIVFTVTLLIKKNKTENKNVSDEDIQLIRKSLIALGLFGGLGSRSRRGFGSLSLEKLLHNDESVWQPPTNEHELKARILEILPSAKLSSVLPEYTAFSRHSRIFIVKNDLDVKHNSDVKNDSGSLKLLNYIGKKLMDYRSNRLSGPSKTGSAVGGKPVRRFIADCQCVLRGDKPPERVAFGLPHNYWFPKSEYKVDVNAERHDRRASPLFIHIHRLTAKLYVAVVILMPARFLPDDEKIKINDKAVPLSPDVERYQVVRDFMDRFPDRLEVIEQ
ncbi:type III-B CRISPR module RAMP protein Cmr1 [Heliobacterium gestii]|uniref:Type III-B CRISPR module RAMP protein Cmr1 n=1 Tax=Heliomicrobium gestii TaxID=2699 RepID=A0A845LAT3_HELGE|nr:type III-B CRISPR module RAMP protein Cmr1 [Heliomicrobium gestii]MBM7865795.1 CRISPR-associated protein Cmr1 [Heliomicrobium gestii]MZP42040.1 type III-B CRISPR module RAMP protein Cmr1 [Heliomicrobium gestii]